jgi:hypothetical protein
MTDHFNFDHKEISLYFFAISFASVCAALSIGGVLDAVVRKLQKDDNWQERKYGKAITYFFLQASFNILILMLFTRSFLYFQPWFQLSISGALFGVLLFTPQRNLADNALRITNF